MQLGTVLLVLVLTAGMVAVLFANGAGPDWFWRGGRGDLMRRALFREDGSWRRFGRFSVFVVWLLIVSAWLFFRGS